MADNNWLDINDDDDDEDFTPSRGNDNALREARKAAKTASRENKALRDQLAQLQASLHEVKVSEAIKSKGLPPKIAKLAANVPVDELDTWIEEYADVFGVPASAGADSGAEGSGIPVNQETLDPNFLALQRIQQGQGGAAAPPVGEADLRAKIAAAQNEQELNMVLFGNPNGPQVF